MSIYKILIAQLETAPPTSWEHPYGHDFSSCTINGVRMTLYSDGIVCFVNTMYGAWPFTSAGKKLYRRVRAASGVPDSPEAREKAELEKLMGGRK